MCRVWGVPLLHDGDLRKPHSADIVVLVRGVAEAAGVDAAADAAGGLKDVVLDAALVEDHGRVEPGDAGADDAEPERRLVRLPRREEARVGLVRQHVRVVRRVAARPPAQHRVARRRDAPRPPVRSVAPAQLLVQLLADQTARVQRPVGRRGVGLHFFLFFSLFSSSVSCLLDWWDCVLFLLLLLRFEILCGADAAAVALAALRGGCCSPPIYMA